MKPGEIVEVNGKKYVVDEDNGLGCDICVAGNDFELCDTMPYCTYTFNPDGISIIFKELPQ